MASELTERTTQLLDEIDVALNTLATTRDKLRLLIEEEDRKQKEQGIGNE